MSSEFGIGIVGLGWVAGAHISTFRQIPGVRVVGVSSRRTLDPDSLEQQYGLPLRAYRSYEEMLSDPDVQIVDICTPHPFHPAQAIAAAQAGKHLIIEKPIALSYKDAAAVARAVQTSGV